MTNKEGSHLLYYQIHNRGERRFCFSVKATIPQLHVNHIRNGYIFRPWKLIGRNICTICSHEQLKTGSGLEPKLSAAIN